MWISKIMYILVRNVIVFFCFLLFNMFMTQAIVKLFLNPTNIQFQFCPNVLSFSTAFYINLGKGLYVWHLEAAVGDASYHIWDSWSTVKENKDICRETEIIL